MATPSQSGSHVSLVDDYVSEYQGIQAQMGDPEIAGDQEQFRKLSKRYAQLQPIIKVNDALVQAREDYEAASEMASEDKEFAEEATRLEGEIVRLEEELADLLAPRDEHDGDDIIMEIKAGAGGEEAALFAADLARMYQKYCEKHDLVWGVLDLAESDLGGAKDMTVSVKSKNPSRDGAWSKLKFEGGVHRVQRVPVTESQGRIQTSAAGVLVYPEPEEIGSVNIDEKDLRVDVYRSSGKGGQGVNTTDSAVRITHLPTNIVVTCQNERSQIQNRARAMQVLQARLDQLERDKADAEAAEGRASQVRTMDRSERIRTYNWPENRISDHRINYKANNLDSVLDGNMDELIAALQDHERQERLEAE
ncbi:peptide chain release factor 1 [Corynebacterium mayonis]|uniref:peptide chain release factor 1 n=1 Tax=Corynebacterium mayonis TaxID=3062461 RepID=UPI0031408119